MKPCWEVDNDGNIIEHYLWEDSQITAAIDSGRVIIDFPWEGGLYEPKFDFEKNNWVSSVTDDFFVNLARFTKTDELNTKCNQTILGRFSFTYTDGNTYYASCDTEAQSNFEKVDRAFEKGRMAEYPWTCYDEAGNVCRLIFTPDTFEPFYLAHLAHISDTIAKFRDELEPRVKAATTTEEINDIQW